jgi:hypothetical protein
MAEAPNTSDATPSTAIAHAIRKLSRPVRLLAVIAISVLTLSFL